MSQFDGLIGGLGGQLGSGRIRHITQQGYDQLTGRVNQVPLYDLAERLRRAQDSERYQQAVGVTNPIGSWPGMIEREISKHLPDGEPYVAFCQRRENRNAYMARIVRGSKLVAEVDVPCELLRYPNRGEWRTQLCRDLSRDIVARAG